MNPNPYQKFDVIYSWIFCTLPNGDQVQDEFRQTKATCPCMHRYLESENRQLVAGPLK